MGRRAIQERERIRAERLVASLISARDERGWSVHDLSTESGVHYETVRAVLDGRSVGPSFFNVADLARALGVSLEHLDAGSRP